MKVPTSPIPAAPPVAGPTPSTADGDPAAAAIFSALVAAVLGGAATEPQAVAVGGEMAAPDGSGLPADASAETQAEDVTTDPSPSGAPVAAPGPEEFLPETLAALLLAMSLSATAAPVPEATRAPGGTVGSTEGELLAGAAPTVLPAAGTATPTSGTTVRPDQVAGSMSGFPAPADTSVAPGSAASSVLPGTPGTPGTPATPVAPVAPMPAAAATAVASSTPGRSDAPGSPQPPSPHTAAFTVPAAGPPTTPVADSAPHQVTSAPAATTTPGAGAEATAPAPAGGQPTSMSPTMAVTPAAAADVPAPGPAVVRQIVPEITRLVSNGTGVHRVTLQLNPEALGEVRVVLTVRDGSVHVRLAAGNAAQQALLEGSPELRRLIEQTGAGETRIVVRDLPSGGASGNTLASASTGPGGDGSPRHESGQAGTASQGSHDRHAGTRDGGPARDGTDDGAIPPRLVDQVTHARSAGVDVTV